MNSLNQGKILIADDDQVIRDFVKMGLEEFGYTVYETNSGLRVKDIIEQNDIALIILDILMDEQEGLETIQQVRQFSPNLPIIAISSSSRYLDYASDFGANEILLKPLDLGILYSLIKKHCNCPA